ETCRWNHRRPFFFVLSDGNPRTGNISSGFPARSIGSGAREKVTQSGCSLGRSPAAIPDDFHAAIPDRARTHLRHLVIYIETPLHGASATARSCSSPAVNPPQKHSCSAAGRNLNQEQRRKNP